jgi:hypothetical protein
VKKTIRVLQVVGWVLAIVGTAAALKTWLDLRHEQQLHAHQAIPLALNVTSGWKDVRFTPGRAGNWKILLTTVNNFSRPDTVEGAPYGGAMEVELVDPRQAVRWRRVVDGPSSGHTKPSNMTWTELASLDLEEGREWTLRARVLRADQAFDRTGSEIRAYPPQVHDMGWYAFGETVKTVLWGAAGMAGFAMVATARVLRRRVQRRPAPNTFSSS